jgi:Tol biopolymer transport system component
MFSSKGIKLLILGLVTLFLVSGLFFKEGLMASTLERITTDWLKDQYDPSISDDGRYVVFSRSSVQGEPIILYDLLEHNEISIAPGSQPVISADGRFVAFTSEATDLVSNDTNGQSDVFIYNRSNGGISRVSLTPGGSQATAGGAYFPSISADGRFVAFESWASNMGGQGSIDVYVHDTLYLTTYLISQSTGGTPGYNISRSPSISADGRLVVFKSWASNLVSDDTNGQPDVFLRDRFYNATVRISRGWNGEEGNGPSGTPAISADGRYIAFTSAATNMVNGDANNHQDVFIHDRGTGWTSLVSVHSNGTQGNNDSGCYDGSYPVRCLALSAHGRYVAFPSLATNLIDDPKWDYQNIFFRDRKAGQTSLISREYFFDTWGEPGDGESTAPAMSANGRFVTFASRAWLMGSETGYDNSDIFVYDHGQGTQDLISLYLPLIMK